MTHNVTKATFGRYHCQGRSILFSVMSMSRKTSSSRKPALRFITKLSNPEQTRREHAQETAQDYVELVDDLIMENGAARAIDIARRLGISHVTVGKTIRRLEKLNLLVAPPYESITLTMIGKKMAAESRERHDLVLRFLLALGVPKGVAESDSEGIEHHVSKETLAAFKRFYRKIAASRTKRLNQPIKRKV